ncbi:HPP family protein [Paenibacillus endoradicis]|uniref:HPP family protein n=1 Tax=Paenibacillus endoradicis TaxID=2972487 RepID=UPI0021591D00|nr:HPP family protein [Paenibacillus endoradicis]MCR8660051.1 HPP family protein [Paenibacillus endoradicis]
MKEIYDDAQTQLPTPIIVNYFNKMKGQGQNPLKVNTKDILTSLVGGFITIISLLLLTSITNSTWLMASFGATCVLAYSAWNAPLSQPRNIIGGHFITSLIGMCMLHWFGDSPWVIGLAVGIAIATMMLTKTTHPPAGANPIIIITGNYGWDFLWSPVLIGALIIVLIALIINNLRQDRAYPTFWY